jgi:hypothetical protein
MHLVLVEDAELSVDWLAEGIPVFRLRGFDPRGWRADGDALVLGPGRAGEQEEGEDGEETADGVAHGTLPGWTRNRVARMLHPRPSRREPMESIRCNPAAVRREVRPSAGTEQEKPLRG